jgi:formylglycine-generating enzyme required for sulfatase activity
MLPGKPAPLIEYTESTAKWQAVRLEILKAIRDRTLEIASRPVTPPTRPATAAGDVSPESPPSAIATPPAAPSSSAAEQAPQPPPAAKAVAKAPAEVLTESGWAAEKAPADAGQVAPHGEHTADPIDDRENQPVGKIQTEETKVPAKKVGEWLVRAGGVVRRKKTLAVGIGLGLLGIAGIIALVVSKELERSRWAIYGPDAPPPAIAPFDAQKAKEHQAGWAKHLGVPVEITNAIGMKLVFIPPGEFEMGSPDSEKDYEFKGAGNCETPQHRVRVTKPFYLGMYDVTQEEYQQVMGSNPSAFPKTNKMGEDRQASQAAKRFPVEQMSWNEAVEFCRKLSEMPEEKAAGRTYGLPSEAQWEYACRAGSAARSYFTEAPAANALTRPAAGFGLDEYAWYEGNSGLQTHPVGQKRPNAWGLYDMYGNVEEWCADWYDDKYYASSPTDDPTGPATGSNRVVRGSSWFSIGICCRSARRFSSPPGVGSFCRGLRVCYVVRVKGQLR